MHAEHLQQLFSSGTRPAMLTHLLHGSCAMLSGTKQCNSRGDTADGACYQSPTHLLLWRQCSHDVNPGQWQKTKGVAVERQNSRRCVPSNRPSTCCSGSSAHNIHFRCRVACQQTASIAVQVVHRSRYCHDAKNREPAALASAPA